MSETELEKFQPLKSSTTFAQFYHT